MIKRFKEFNEADLCMEEKDILSILAELESEGKE